MIPRIYNHSYSSPPTLSVPEGGAEGVIVAEADHLGGFTLYVKDGKLTHTYSMMGVFSSSRSPSRTCPRRGDCPHGVRGRCGEAGEPVAR